MTDFAPGIHFNMPEAEYHSVPALGASALKDLLVSPLTYWMNSPLNPYREENDTEAKDKGSAFHKRILEGAEEFAKHYAVKPVKEDYPEALDGAAALKDRCAELGLKKGGTIAELCARIKEADPDAVLWPEIVAQWQAENEGKIPVSVKDWVEIERHAKIAEAHEGTMNAFRGGQPEVSLFWTDEAGIPCKARVDYLKVRAAVDLKSFSNPFGMPVDQAVGKAVANYGYHVQAVHYMTGLETVKRMLLADPSLARGEIPSADWLNAFLAPGPHRFFFVFLETGAVPNTRIREFRASAGNGGERNAYWIAAEMRIAKAKEIYTACMTEYGPDKPWVDPQPSRPLEDTDLPLWALD